MNPLYEAYSKPLTAGRGLPAPVTIQRRNPDTSKYLSLREDGSKKGRGFFGELSRPDGRVSSEISVGVERGGKEITIPSLVPTLNRAEIEHLLQGGDPTPEIVKKAVEHAKPRMAAGRSPFIEDDEQVVDLPPASRFPLTLGRQPTGPYPLSR